MQQVETLSRNHSEPTADCGWKTGLPVDGLLILMPTDISPTTVAVHAEGTLIEPEELPGPVFAPMDFLTSGRTVRATPDELARLKLASIFSANPSAQIVSIPLVPDDPISGFLLCKIAPEHSLDHVRTMCRRHSDSMRALLRESRQLIESYERDLMLVVYDLQPPAVITDSKHWIAAANGAFCELVGRSQSDLAGKDLFDVFRLETDLPDEMPLYPEHATLTSALYIKTQALFFVSELRLSRISTSCGHHVIHVFRDLLTHQRTGNSNIQLVQKLSAMVMAEERPGTLIRRIINTLAATLNCDLVCVLRRKDDHEMLVTPHLNRNMKTLRANLVTRSRDEILEPFFSHGNPVFCADVESTCPQDGFFRQVQHISQFAFVPAGHGGSPEYALLLAWSDPSDTVGPRMMPLLRTAANLLGAALLRSKLVSEMDQEKDILRRYTRLTAGREVRMADLKRENAALRELLMKINNKAKE